MGMLKIKFIVVFISGEEEKEMVYLVSTPSTI